MSDTQSGFKLTPRKLLFIALAIVALIVFALVGYTFSVVTTKEQIKRTDQTGTGAEQPQVELLSPNGGKSTVISVQSASQAPKESDEEGKDKEPKDGENQPEHDQESSREEPPAEERSNNPPPAPRAAPKPQAAPKRNTQPAAESAERNVQQETPVEPIRRSREPVHNTEQPGRSHRNERPAPAPQREVMDNLF